MNEKNLESLKKELGITNVHALPKVMKIVISTGIGNIKDQTSVQQIIRDLASITGQKPIITRAKKSIAGFKVRQGDKVGLTLNLRGKRMYHFLHKLIHVVLPAIRDFRGIPTSAFDKNGNLTIGIQEYAVFPEISYQTVGVTYGLAITIVTNATSHHEAIGLMKAFGLPLSSG